MRIREGLVLRKVGETWAVFPINEALKQYGNIMKLNDTGALLWNMLQKECSKEELCTALIEEYEIDNNTAENAVGSFVDVMLSQGILQG